MQPRQSSKCSITARLTLAAHPPCAGHSCFFAANFGSHCLGEAWKKASSGSGPAYRRRCAHLMRNTSLACVHPTRGLNLPRSAGNHFAPLHRFWLFYFEA